MVLDLTLFDPALLWGLAVLFVMAFFSNGIIPLPITPYVIWLGHFHQPVATVLVGTVASVLGWWVLCRFLKQKTSGQTDWSQKIPAAYRHTMCRHLTLWLFIFNALPLPVDLMRFVAVAHGHDLKKQLWALGGGRVVRYTLLVTMGQWLSHHQEWFVGVIVAFLILPFGIHALLKQLPADASDPLSDKLPTTASPHTPQSS